MKVNPILTLIAVAVAALLGYCFYSFHSGENQLMLAVGSFLSLAVILFGVLSVKFPETPRTTINIRATSATFFVLSLVSNIIFCCVNFSQPAYIIVNGLLLLLFVVIIYSLGKVKE